MNDLFQLHDCIRLAVPLTVAQVFLLRYVDGRGGVWVSDVFHPPLLLYN